MDMVVSIALYFIPLIAVFLCMAILVKGFKKLTGIIACLLGLLSFVPIMVLDFLQNLILDGSQISQLLKFILLALIEEGIKMVLLFLLPYKKSSLKVFFCYAALSGLMLASFESLLYVIVFKSTNRIAPMIIHVACSGLSGVFVYSVRKKNTFITPFIFAVLFHGVYNYFADFTSFVRYFAYIVILIALVECKLRYEVLKAEIAENDISDNFENNIKGDSKNMGFKDVFGKIGKLFGKKDEPAEQNLPEQTVFNSAATVSDSELNEEKEPTVVASSEKTEPAEEKAPVSAFHEYPKIDKLFNEEDDVPEAVVAEPKVEEPKTVEPAAAKVEETATVRKTRTTATKKTASSTEEKAPAKRGRKPAAAKADTTTEVKAPAKRGRKPAAEKTAETAPKTTTRGRKPAAAKADDTVAAVKTTAKKTAKTVAEKTTTAAKKTTAAAKKTTTAAAAKETVKKAATTAKKTATAAAKTTTTAAKKTAAKTTTAAKKTATAAKETVKKATTTAKKTATTAAKKTTTAAKKATTKKTDK